MRRNLVYNFLMRPQLIICPLLLVICGAPVAGVAPEGICPADMALADGGGFCIDKYEFPNKKGVAPFRGLDSDEAIQLCASRGKRLPTPAEFTLACGGAEKATFPYGSSHVPDKCRSGLSWADGPAPSGSYPGCERNGVYDLAGNVWEWVRPPDGQLIIAGGAWNTASTNSTCHSFDLMQNGVISPNVGVRCVKSVAGRGPADFH